MAFDLSKIEGFDWNQGNIDKNLKKHGIKDQEAEQVFSNNPFISEDIKHSYSEERYNVLGETHKAGLLFVSFTVRKIDNKLKIRIISARNMNKKEEVKYEKIQKNT